MQEENTNYFISGLESVSESRVGIVRLELVKEERYLYGMKNFTSTKEAAQMVEPLFAHADREMMVVLSLDVRLKPVACEVAAVGGLSSCIVDIGNLFKHAILTNAANIICFHNHPSGDAEPSKEDILITKRMQKAGEILGIPLADHIIIGDGCYCSLAERGEIKRRSEKGGDENADH